MKKGGAGDNTWVTKMKIVDGSVEGIDAMTAQRFQDPTMIGRETEDGPALSCLSIRKRYLPTQVLPVELQDAGNLQLLVFAAAGERKFHG